MAVGLIGYKKNKKKISDSLPLNRSRGVSFKNLKSSYQSIEMSKRSAETLFFSSEIKYF